MASKCMVQAQEESLEMSGDSSHGEEDEAPDEITFNSARQKAQRSVKTALESVRRDKALLKEKRRRKVELFREQKIRKLLPDDILEEIASIPKKNDQAPRTSKKGPNRASVQKPEQDSGLEEDVEECIDVRWKEHNKAVRLKDYGKKTQQVKKAKDFVRSRLYGSRCRSSVNEYFSYENKRVHKAAMQFVDSSWGAKKKQKAEKFRKLWIQKHVPIG